MVDEKRHKNPFFSDKRAVYSISDAHCFLFTQSFVGNLIRNKFCLKKFLPSLHFSEILPKNGVCSAGEYVFLADRAVSQILIRSNRRSISIQNEQNNTGVTSSERELSELRHQCLYTCTASCSHLRRIHYRLW